MLCEDGLPACRMSQADAVAHSGFDLVSAWRDTCMRNSFGYHNTFTLAINIVIAYPLLC